MADSHLACPHCHRWLRAEALNLSDLTPCHGCGTQLDAQVFAALFRKGAPGQIGETVLVDGESTCFNHPQKQALLPCHGCGRFLCALCDCEVRGEHFCPSCLEQGKTSGKIKHLENHRVLYDTIALSLAVVPVVLIFFIYFTFITAPMALFVGVRYWNAPRSIVHRTKVRLVLAIVFASAQIVGWVAILAFALGVIL